MDYIGKYDSLPVYEANGQKIPTNTNNLYVTANGTMYYGGVAIGKLDPKTYKVLSYNKELYYKEMRKQEEAKKVPAPTCVAETAAVGKNGELSGADAFFAQIAKDIDDTLKSAKGSETWTFV